MSHFYRRNEEIWELTKSILFEIGAIKKCEYHDDWYYSTHMENKQLYALATDKFKEQCDSSNFKLFHMNIKDIMQQAGDKPSDCPFCIKIQEE